MTLEAIYKELLKSGGVCTDTRQEVSNTLFFALRGDNFDGNRFVREALQKGCRLAITESKELEGETGVLVVPSVLEQLQQLAHHHRNVISPRVLAITGSNGKTTTKELISAILSTRYSVLATAGNLNNHIGVPLTLLSLKNEEVAVIEMGANHAGEISQLARIASPDLGLITNIGKAHLEGFGSLEGVLDAKTELYGYLAEKGRSAIIDGNDATLLGRAEKMGVDCLVTGKDTNLPVSASIVKQSPFLEVELNVDGRSHHLSTNLVGAYNLQNVMLAVAVGYQFGIPVPDMIKAVSEYIPENQRSQFLKGKYNHIILDAYNANPTSMLEAITGLLQYANPPVMLILGDMAEMGDKSHEEHVALIQWIESLDIDRVLLVGPKFKEAVGPSSSFDVYEERNEVENLLRNERPEGFHILVKGSRIMELEKLVPFLDEMAT